MTRSHLILPIFPRPPSYDAQRAAYARSLVGVLEARFKESGEVDDALADRIERVLWGTETSLPVGVVSEGSK